MCFLYHPLISLLKTIDKLLKAATIRKVINYKHVPCDYSKTINRLLTVYSFMSLNISNHMQHLKYNHTNSFQYSTYYTQDLPHF